MKKVLKAILLGAALSAITSTACFAAEKEVRFTLNAPEGFHERVEVYLNREEHPMYDGYYEMTLSLDEGEYDVVVLSSTDVTDRYEFQYDKSFNTDDTSHFTITAVAADAGEAEPSDDQFPGDSGFTNVEGDSMLNPEAAGYDFSNGAESGTISIACRDYPAFQSVSFSLVGDKIYTIELKRENGFSANVRLPIGSYYESSDFDCTLSEGIKADSINFSWQHEGKIGSFGRYYEVTENSAQELNDLVIYMVYNGDIAEVDTDVLADEVTFNEKLEAKNKHNLEELQEAFPGDYDETEPETIAEAEPVEEQDEMNILAMAAAAAAVFGAAVMIAIVMMIIKKRKND